MTGPATPGQEGPSFAPPPLPPGWIAQWDGMSKKYYFVQLSTGASQWDTPNAPAPTGPTPQATPQEGLDHPYGKPNEGLGAAGIRGLEGGNGERGLGAFAMNQLLGSSKNNHNSGSGGLAGLAGQFMGGGSGNHQSGSSSGGGLAGALIGGLLGGKKKQEQYTQQTHTGSPHPGQHHQGSGLLGDLGGFFIEHPQGSSNNFGYSSLGNQQGGYSAQAPPESYQPSGKAPDSYNPAKQQHPQQLYAQNQQLNSPLPPYYDPANPQSSYGVPFHAQEPSYGAPTDAYHPPVQQPHHGGGIPQQHQHNYGPAHGAPQHQYGYGAHYPVEQGYGGAQQSGTAPGGMYGSHSTPVPGGTYANHGPEGYREHQGLPKW